MKTNDQIALDAMASRIRELEYGIKMRDMALEQTIGFISYLHVNRISQIAGRAILDDYVEVIDMNMSEMSGDIKTDYLASLCYSHIDKSLLLGGHNVKEIESRLSASGYQHDK